jgi:hypothetical protein
VAVNTEAAERDQSRAHPRRGEKAGSGRQEATAESAARHHQPNPLFSPPPQKGTRRRECRERREDGGTCPAPQRHHAPPCRAAMMPASRGRGLESPIAYSARAHAPALLAAEERERNRPASPRARGRVERQPSDAGPMGAVVAEGAGGGCRDCFGFVHPCRVGRGHER